MPKHRRDDMLTRITRQAGDFVLRSQRKIARIQYKEDKQKSAATNIDVAAEKMIIRTIKRFFPNDGIIGEELGATQGSSEYLWIIDPIDGTANYILSLPLYCTTVALLKNGHVVTGAIYDPTRREMFFAKRNRGAYLDGKRLRLKNSVKLSKATGSFSSTDPKKGIQIFTHVASELRKPRYLGSTAISLAYVASDRLQTSIFYGVNSWDAASGVLLVEEAGGIARTFDYRKLKLHSQKKMNILVGRSGIVRELSRVLRKTPSLI
ncbi:MAG: inositol monophosphatase family protein [Parcubacteria group bacterium]